MFFARLPAGERQRLIANVRRRPDGDVLPPPHGYTATMVWSGTDRANLEYSLPVSDPEEEISIFWLRSDTRHVVVTSPRRNVALLSYDYKEVEGYPTLCIDRLRTVESTLDEILVYYLMTCAFRMAQDAGMHFIVIKCKRGDYETRRFYMDLGFSRPTWEEWDHETDETYELLSIAATWPHRLPSWYGMLEL